MANARKWYVVWEGKAPGIYDSWEECELQVKGYAGAKYKAYPTQESATKAFRDYDPSTDRAIIKEIARHATPKRVNYSAIKEIELNSIAVDAACSGYPGPMEYQGVRVDTGEVLFHVGPIENGANNLGEFIAIVHALALTKQQGLSTTIYSDSVTALSWVRNRHCKTTITPNGKNARVMALLERAKIWLAHNTYRNKILKWRTDEWGEIPADFGRK